VRYKTFVYLIALISLFGLSPEKVSGSPAAATYYVSSSLGKDTNDGKSESAPFASIQKVNTLALQPGDRVLFKCGDVWRANPLILSWSGTTSAPIQFSSYPAGCPVQPVLSGSRQITGWVYDSGNIYFANLPAIDFPYGINQLFRRDSRLTLGRWPNLNDPGGGYSAITAHTAGSSQLVDDTLPSGNWIGAVVHIKNIRWSMVDRQVTSSSSYTLYLNKGLSCLISSWGSCVDWGYFINNSLNTLDQDGEWYYDQALRRVYLVSTSGIPDQIEGSVVLEAGASRLGGIMLSNGAATAFVSIDHLVVKNWFNDGIGTPAGMTNEIYHDITIQDVTIKDVDASGINLTSWLQRPADGLLGHRGGNRMRVANTLIDGANDFGVTGYFAQSTFEHNTIENIALIRNLNASGMGCGLSSDECTENGDGFRIRTDFVSNSGSGNTLRFNRIDKIGYNGVDIFGPDTTLENNFITQACFSKADCGAVRVFGGNNLASTPVYNIHLIDNVILDIPGNVDGCHPSRAAFGMGLYIDHYSRDVETRGNTIINTTVSGILYQQSTGQILNNTVFNASSGVEYSSQIDLGGSETRVSMAGNIMFGLGTHAWTLYVYSLANLVSSDQNYFFHPYVNQSIASGDTWTRRSFAQWQAYSGRDSHSKATWFTQSVGEASRAIILYNSTSARLTVTLGDRQYLDLDQLPYSSSLTLLPFSSKILVDNGLAPLELHSLFPELFSASHAVNFVLTVRGTGFSLNSVVLWNGQDRPTTFVDSTCLQAAIPASDVITPGNFAVVVRDPFPPPGGTQTASVMFHVLPSVFDAFLPYLSR
jgi:hypothetical protein